MKKSIALILPLAALSLAALSFTACGTKTEEKTTVIEKRVEVPVAAPAPAPAPAPVPVQEPKKGVSVTVEGDGKNTHYEVHGSN